MSVNQTIYEISDKEKSALFRYSIYVVEGCVMIVTNGLIMLPIVWYKALRSRKEYIIIGSLALADTVAGISIASAGIWRIPLFLTGDYRTRVTRHYCLCTPHVVMWTFLGPAAFSLLALVSLDRALAVGKPFFYLSLEQAYAQVLVAGCYCLSLVIGVFTLTTSWISVNPPKINPIKICTSSMAWGMKAHSVRDPINVMFISIAIGLYALVPVLYHKYLKSASNDNGPNANQLKKQQKLTKTVAFSCFATFVFVALPMIVRSVLANVFDAPELFQSVIPWMAIINDFNPILNFFIYFKRQKELRVGLRGVLSNKIMPNNIDLWQNY